MRALIMPDKSPWEEFPGTDDNYPMWESGSANVHDQSSPDITMPSASAFRCLLASEGVVETFPI